VGNRDLFRDVNERHIQLWDSQQNISIKISCATASKIWCMSNHSRLATSFRKVVERERFALIEQIKITLCESYIPLTRSSISALRGAGEGLQRH
jgi:hypothetical protein